MRERAAKVARVGVRAAGMAMALVIAVAIAGCARGGESKPAPAPDASGKTLTVMSYTATRRVQVSAGMFAGIAIMYLTAMILTLVSGVRS